MKAANQHGSGASAWRRSLRLQWGFALVCFFLVMIAVFALFFPERLPGFLRVPARLESYLNGNAVVEILGTMGLLAIVGGPLLGVTEQRVLGERIGTLVTWAYPIFFRFYFVLFIISTLLGIYAAAAGGNRTPVFFALAVVLPGTCFILRVCYVFLVPGVGRERLALTYYMNQLTLREKRPLLRPSGKELSPEAARAYLLRSRLLMLKLAGALARREAEGRALWTENIRALWARCAGQCEAAQELLDDRHPQAAADHCCLLAKKFWELLSRQAEMPLSQLELLPALLFSRVPSQPPAGESEEEREERKKREKRELQAEHCLAAGLLFTEAFHQAGTDYAWQAPYQLLCEIYQGRDEWVDKKSRIAFKKLFWGLAWIMVVHFVYERKANFRFLRELYYRGEMYQTSPAEEEELRGFLALLHKFYLRNTRFQDGISTGGGPVYYETKLLYFLEVYLDNPREIDVEDDLAVVRAIVLKEEM